MTHTSHAKILLSMQEKATPPLVDRLPSFEVFKANEFVDALAALHPHDQCFPKFAESHPTWFYNTPKIIDDYIDDCPKYKAITVSA